MYEEENSEIEGRKERKKEMYKASQKEMLEDRFALFGIVPDTAVVGAAGGGVAVAAAVAASAVAAGTWWAAAVGVGERPDPARQPGSATCPWPPCSARTRHA